MWYAFLVDVDNLYFVLHITACALPSSACMLYPSLYHCDTYTCKSLSGCAIYCIPTNYMVKGFFFGGGVGGKHEYSNHQA